MNPLRVYGLDSVGLLVDTNPLGNPDAALTKAQNAIPDPAGEAGSIRKRPGLKAFNAVAGSGVVTGGIPVPLFVGGAGPDFNNPWTDILVSTLALTTPIFVLTQPVLPSFEDDSFEFIFDPLEDFIDTEDPQLDPITPETPDTFEIVTVNTTQAALVPLDYFGTIASAIWRLLLDQVASQTISNETSYPNTADLLFPQHAVRATSVDLVPYGLNNWYANGSSSRLDGYPTVVMNNILYYIRGTAA